MIFIAGCAQQTEEDATDRLGFDTDEQCEAANPGCDCTFNLCDIVPQGMTYEEACGPAGWVCLDKLDNGVDSMEIVENGDKVKVEYKGTFPDTGEVFDKSEGRGPLEFEAGAGQMIKGFDAAVIGMKLNEEKTVTIAPENAYGKAGEGQRIEADLNQISADGNVTVGMDVFATNGMQGKVESIDGNKAILLFEHPLAGKTLEFWIKVVEIQK